MILKYGCAEDRNLFPEFVNKDKENKEDTDFPSHNTAILFAVAAPR